MKVSFELCFLHRSSSLAAITCASLSPIVNGMIMYSPDQTSPYDYNTIATHSCNEGFFLEGEQTRSCSGDGSSTTGEWGGVPPICAGMFCSDTIL